MSNKLKKSKRNYNTQGHYKINKNMSPFEFRAILLDYAIKKGGNSKLKVNSNTILDASSGNPNFFNTHIRTIFSNFQDICIQICNQFLKEFEEQNNYNFTNKNSESVLYPNINYVTKKHYIHLINKTKSISNSNKEIMNGYLNYLEKISTKKDNIFSDLLFSILGVKYPNPPICQKCCQLVSLEYFKDNYLEENKKKYKDYECFATEGAAAGMVYFFNTLSKNYILNKGDYIAILSPVFSPYLEIPKLPEYGLNVIYIECNYSDNFNIPENEINKLNDKRIKCFFLCNPTNPGSHSLSEKNVIQIKNIVNKNRKDLIIFEDSVYSPFCKEYHSLVNYLPKNTIEILSLSKYYGVTGWRLGLIFINKNNIINELLRELPKKYKKILKYRYSFITNKENSFSFTERIVADSRQVTLNHVSGLSTPQQVLISLFLFYSKTKYFKIYDQNVKNMLFRRSKALLEPLKLKVDNSDKNTNYYVLLDIKKITNIFHGKDGEQKLINNYNFTGFLILLAEKYKVILLPGSGFRTQPWFIRVSLSNLYGKDYERIGERIKKCIDYLIHNVKSQNIKKTKKNN